MLRLLAFAIVALSLALPAPSFADTPAFEVGQVWTLRAPAAATLRVQIGRIDVVRGRWVVSVAVTGVPCPVALRCRTMPIGHMPFNEAVLRASVDHVESTGAVGAPFFEEGYQAWRASDQAGAWTRPVHLAVDIAVHDLVERQAEANRPAS